jgi:hypothetical protein
MIGPNSVTRMEARVTKASSITRPAQTDVSHNWARLVASQRLEHASDQPWRPALLPADALDELQRGAGTLFEARAVEAVRLKAERAQRAA